MSNKCTQFVVKLNLSYLFVYFARFWNYYIQINDLQLSLSSFGKLQISEPKSWRRTCHSWLLSFDRQKQFLETVCIKKQTELFIACTFLLKTVLHSWAYVCLGWVRVKMLFMVTVRRRNNINKQTEDETNEQTNKNKLNINSLKSKMHDSIALIL